MMRNLPLFRWQRRSVTRIAERQDVDDPRPVARNNGDPGHRVRCGRWQVGGPRRPGRQSCRGASARTGSLRSVGVPQWSTPGAGMTREATGVSQPDDLLRVWYESDTVVGRFVVHAAGEVDLTSASRLDDVLDEVAGASMSGPVVLDLTSVTFLSSVGLGLLV